MAKGRKTGGRQKGSPNKATAELKDMILNALDAAGGEQYLQEQAAENPSAFIALLGKVLPKDVTVRVPDGLSLSISLSSGNQLPIR